MKRCQHLWTCWLTTKHHGSREAGATPIFTALIGHATPAFRQWPGASSWAAEGRGHGRWWFFGWRHFQLMGKWVVWGPGGLDFPGIPENERDWDCYLGVTPMRKSQTTWDPHHPFTHYSWTFLEDSDSHSDGHMTWILVYKTRLSRWRFFLISTRSEISWRARDAI